MVFQNIALCFFFAVVIQMSCSHPLDKDDTTAGRGVGYEDAVITSVTTGQSSESPTSQEQSSGNFTGNVDGDNNDQGNQGDGANNDDSNSSSEGMEDNKNDEEEADEVQDDPEVYPSLTYPGNTYLGSNGYSDSQIPQPNTPTSYFLSTGGDDFVDTEDEETNNHMTLSMENMLSLLNSLSQHF